MGEKRAIKDIGQYSFHYFPSDRFHRPHVHVFGPDKRQSKYYINPIELFWGNLRSEENTQVIKLLREHENDILKDWEKFFDFK